MDVYTKRRKVHAEFWDGYLTSIAGPNREDFAHFGIRELEKSDDYGGKYVLVLDFDDGVFVYPGQWVVFDESMGEDLEPLVYSDDAFRQRYDRDDA